MIFSLTRMYLLITLLMGALMLTWSHALAYQVTSTATTSPELIPELIDAEVAQGIVDVMIIHNNGRFIVLQGGSRVYIEDISGLHRINNLLISEQGMVYRLGLTGVSDISSPNYLLSLGSPAPL